MIVDVDKERCDQTNYAMASKDDLGVICLLAAKVIACVIGLIV